MKRFTGTLLLIIGVAFFLSKPSILSAVVILCGIIFFVKPNIILELLSVSDDSKSVDVTSHTYSASRQNTEARNSWSEKHRQERDLYLKEHKIHPTKLYSPKGRKLPVNYVVLDFETTGLNHLFDKIIEIGAVKVQNGKVVDTFSSLVNPGKEISKKITEITGITNNDLSDAPSQDEIMEDFYSFISGHPLVAHNFCFDSDYLIMALHDCGIEDDTFSGFDTLQLARAFLPGLDNYKLSTLINEFQLAEGQQTHRALDDAMATKKLFELIRSKREEMNTAEK